MRFFNTAGPVRSSDHYCLPPLERVDLEGMISLIDQGKYFVLHAPRQTGKTSCLLALMNHLNTRAAHKSLYINVESAQAAREDVYRGIRAILAELSSSAKLHLEDAFVAETWKQILEESGEDTALNETLTMWSRASNKPVVLLVDEIDSLVGDTLISVLRQLRSGYYKRPGAFPLSVILCGVRDVRDYRIHSSREKEVVTGGSAFNVKAKSLRLEDFSREEIGSLYLQHTDETGQQFEEGCFDLVWDLTRGQPWLVNALAYEACFEMKESRDRSRIITSVMLDQAREAIILRRETHMDQLLDKLREERVRRVIEPILVGKSIEEEFIPEEVQYVIDLGLIYQESFGALHIANRIYQEVIPRELAWSAQMGIHEKTSWYVDSNGRLNMDRLLRAFQEFFREHSEHWLERFQYREAGPQLLLQAFLQRIVNSGGRIEREYGLGRMRTDLMLIWPYGSLEKQLQKVIIELKILHKSLEMTIREGLEQTVSYMERCGTLEGHLIVFDRDPSKSWDEKTFTAVRECRGKAVSVWGM